MQTLRGTPQVVDEILKLLIIVSSECISERIVEQHVDVFVQQVTKEIIEVLRLMFQERTRSRTGEEIMDILVPQGSGTDWRSGQWTPKERVVAHWWQDADGTHHGGNRRSGSACAPRTHRGADSRNPVPGTREEIAEETQLLHVGRLQEQVAEQIMDILVPQIVEVIALIQEQIV